MLVFHTVRLERANFEERGVRRFAQLLVTGFCKLGKVTPSYVAVGKDYEVTRAWDYLPLHRRLQEALRARGLPRP